MANTQNKMLPTDTTCCYYQPCNADRDKHYCHLVYRCGMKPCVSIEGVHCCRHGFTSICKSVAADRLERIALVQDMKEKMTDEAIVAVIKKYWDLPLVAGWVDFVDAACGELEEIRALFPTRYIERVDEIPQNLRSYRDVVERAHEHVETYFEMYEERFSD